MMLLPGSRAAADEPPAEAKASQAPLPLSTVVGVAAAQRPEVKAALAKIAAAEQRPAIVSALEDPMVMLGIDHYPYATMDPAPTGEDTGMVPMATETAFGRFDWSIAVEQRFPLSRVRAHRRAGAEAEIRQRNAEADGVGLDVRMSAVEAFLMLRERRLMLEVTRRRSEIGEQLASLSAIKLATATGSQADLLRAEVDLARSTGQARGLAGEAAEAEAMLNAAMGRPPAAPVPSLVEPELEAAPPTLEAALATARRHRPELRVAEAEIARAGTEVDVMKSMYAPMGLVRIGQASTMSEGRGAMVMVGVSVPLGRKRLRAGVAEARAMEAMVRAEAEAMRLMVDGEVAAARARVIAERGRLNAFRDDVVPRSRLAVRSALAAYGVGNGSLEAVVDAVRQQWLAEGEVVMAESELMLALARLDRVQGISPDTALSR
ncbi:MAG: TolC family protein [Pseudomonadota bacterium]